MDRLEAKKNFSHFLLLLIAQIMLVLLDPTVLKGLLTCEPAFEIGLNELLYELFRIS